MVIPSQIINTYGGRRHEHRNTRGAD
nr:unnamed protein product [Callosobruchus analis]